MNSAAERFHRVQAGAYGRWLVVHSLPGTTAMAIDADCLTRGAAERECDWLNLARQHEARQLAEERGLCGTMAVHS